jgi:hypothetical protein
MRTENEVVAGEQVSVEDILTPHQRRKQSALHPESIVGECDEIQPESGQVRLCRIEGNLLEYAEGGGASQSTRILLLLVFV